MVVAVLQPTPNHYNIGIVDEILTSCWGGREERPFPPCLVGRLDDDNCSRVLDRFHLI